MSHGIMQSEHIVLSELFSEETERLRELLDGCELPCQRCYLPEITTDNPELTEEAIKEAKEIVKNINDRLSKYGFHSEISFVDYNSEDGDIYDTMRDGLNIVYDEDAVVANPVILDLRALYPDGQKVTVETMTEWG